MNKFLRLFFTPLFILFVQVVIAQPTNDFQCNPQTLGLLPSPPPCPSSGGVQFGSVVNVTGTTIGATNDGLSGALTSCYSTTAPPLKDVWYKFSASESHVEITIQGVSATPLSNVYIALYESLTDECVGLIPRHCFSASGPGPHTFDFGPLAWGVKYYLQIASTTPTTGNGNFLLSLKSKSICSDCMKNSVLQAYPLPVQAAYPPDTTVGFCYTVVGYNEKFGNRLHGVVPLFGSGWDATTLNIISTADSADFQGQWKWFSNISIPGDPNISGFFYDVGGDNDPTNNLGDHNTIPHLWTFCFTIKTHKQSLCTAGQDDLSIKFLNFSDGESGSLITSQTCVGDEDYVFDAHMECCSKPLFAIPQSTSCDNSPNGSIDAFGGEPFSFTGYKYELYNDAGIKIDSTQIVGATQYTNNSLVAGNYYLYVTNNQAGCQTAVNFQIFGPLIYSLQQTNFGCGSACTNSAQLFIDAGATQSILWDNGSTGPVATNLCPGWHTISMTDTGTVACTIVDSIFITPLPMGDTQFDYSQTNYCSSDIAIITDFPTASGGTFSIVGSSVTTSINPSTGTIDLSTVSGSGFIYIKYQTSAPCFATSFDTIQVEASPPPVSIYSSSHVICFGDANPNFNNTSIYTINWYDTTGFIGTQSSGTFFDPFLGASMPVGSYNFSVTQVDFGVSSCGSIPIPINITVSPLPLVDAGQSESTCLGFGVQLQGTGANSFYWQPDVLVDNPNSATPTATINQTTVFTVVGTNTTTGCSATDTVTIFIDSLGACDLVIYHGITPNGDGHNDFWYIDGISNFANNVVTIFNRWGDKIWDGVGYNNKTVRWEGQAFNGSKVPDGTYYYVIELTDKTFKGWVEVTR